jgi:hypothetical protein
MTTADAENRKPTLCQCRYAGFCSCRDGYALDADELEALIRPALHFKAQFDRFANTQGHVVQRQSLRVAARKLRNGGNVIPLRISLNHYVELAWQWNYPRLPF